MSEEPTAENDAPRYWWSITIYPAPCAVALSGPGSVIPPVKGNPS